ncbi:MAG: tetratricopeptide repeat protein [Candidatus Sumerlaeia bacterium]|nr:tetratricopeptide repeat protein [Candidatus Sumerlaeia bacterium]
MAPTNAPAWLGTLAVTAVGFAVGDGGFLSGVLAGAAWDGIKSSVGPKFRARFLSGFRKPQNDLALALNRATVRALYNARSAYAKFPESPEDPSRIDAFFDEIQSGQLLAFESVDILRIANMSRDEAQRLVRDDLLKGPLDGCPESFRNFLPGYLATHLPVEFLEELKATTEEGTRAWRAFQMGMHASLIESVRQDASLAEAQGREMDEKLARIEARLEALQNQPRSDDEPFSEFLVGRLDALRTELLAAEQRLHESIHEDGEQTREEIRSLRKQVLAQRPSEDAPPVHPDDIADTPLFIARDPELEALDHAFPPSGATTACTVTSVEGMPGVGKSFLARHFAATRSGRFPGGLLALVLDREDTRNGRELLRVLHARFRLNDEATADISLRERLRTLRTLLLVENVDGEPQARAAAEVVRALHGCDVLITGRWTELGVTQGWRQMTIKPFTENEGFDQLHVELGRPDMAPKKEKELRQLVAGLGCLPLAIHLAAPYLRDGDTPVHFLEMLRASGYKLPHWDAADPLQADQARGIIKAVFDLSLAKLTATQGGERLCTGLRRLGWAPPAGFGASLGTALAGMDESEFDHLQRAARRLSLLDREGAAPHCRYRIHMLLSELLRHDGPENELPVLEGMTAWFEKRLQAHGSLLANLNAEEPNLPVWLRLLCEALEADRMPVERCWQVERSASQYAQLRGPFHTWRAFLESTLTRTPEAPQRSNVLWTLGKVALAGGDPERALELGREKYELDHSRSNLRGAALAAGLIADVLLLRGALADALEIYRQKQLPVFEGLEDTYSRAVTLERVARVLFLQRRFDEALQVLREETLPAFKQIGDVRSYVATLNCIAMVLEAQGHQAEALRMRLEEVVPACERLGDVNMKAGVIFSVARHLTLQGKYIEALRLLRNEVLPIFERVGDVRSRAATMMSIADVLCAQGDFDEALRILQNEALPTFVRISDMRERTIARGKIADILIALGNLDEALCMLREDVLPSFAMLCDEHQWAVTMGKIADILFRRGDLDESMRIYCDEQLPVYRRIGDKREQAVAFSRVADVLFARGELDKALGILRDEVLPTVERLTDVRGRLVCWTKIATILMKRNAPGDREEARDLLGRARADAERLGLPEAQLIRDFQADLETEGYSSAGD